MGDAATAKTVTASASAAAAPSGGPLVAYGDSHSDGEKAKKPTGKKTQTYDAGPMFDAEVWSIASDSDQEHGTESIWSCETCTFHNAKVEAPVCELCGTPRKTSHLS